MKNASGKGRFPTSYLLPVLIFLCPHLLAMEDGVVLFDRPHYRGNSEVFFEDDANLKGNRIGNDSISSIQIPVGCRVTLYEHKNFRGRSIELTNSQPNLARAGFAKTVSSLRIAWPGPTRRDNRSLPRDAAILFKEPGFRGAYHLLRSDTARLPPEFCGKAAIGSIKVPSGCLLTLYTKEDYRGRGQVFQGDLADFSGAVIGYSGVSSARVQWEEGGRHLPLPGPSTRAVILYEHEHFQGNSEPVYQDDSNLVDNAIGNDRVSSIHVPEGMRVTLYQHRDFGGRSLTLDRSHPDLGETRLGNDHLSSIRIHAHGTPAVRPVRNQSIVLYEHTGFGGREMITEEDISNLKRTEFGNDRLSSIRVPPGFRVILYQHADFHGRSTVLTRDEADLGRSEVGDDQVSSLRIERVATRFPRSPRSSGDQAGDRGSVMLYRGANFGGQGFEVHEDIANLKRTEFGNDVLSSLRIPDGWRVIVYEHADYKGQSEVLYSDVLSLANHRIGENRISSIRVEWIGRRR